MSGPTGTAIAQRLHPGAEKFGGRLPLADRGEGTGEFAAIDEAFDEGVGRGIKLCPAFLPREGGARQQRGTAAQRQTAEQRAARNHHVHPSLSSILSISLR